MKQFGAVGDVLASRGSEILVTPAPLLNNRQKAALFSIWGARLVRVFFEKNALTCPPIFTDLADFQKNYATQANDTTFLNFYRRDLDKEVALPDGFEPSDEWPNIEHADSSVQLSISLFQPDADADDPQFWEKLVFYAMHPTIDYAIDQHSREVEKISVRDLSRFEEGEGKVPDIVLNSPVFQADILETNNFIKIIQNNRIDCILKYVENDFKSKIIV